MLQVVSSVGIISFGWDCPQVSCAILARPTQSFALYRQQVGRILRPFPAPRGDRSYQQTMLNDLRQALRSHRRILMVAPTGSGKGYIAGEITRGATAKGYGIGFLVNRRTLVHDFSRRLDDLQIPHGVIMAGHPRWNPELPTQVISIDTLRSRGTQLSVDCLFLDEAHQCTESFARITEAYPDTPVIGMTATPVRMTGGGLGRLFDVMIQGPTTQDLTDQGYLSPARLLGPSVPELRETGGEYTENEMLAAMDRGAIIGNIVSTWKKHASDRKTVVFAVNVAHSRRIVEQFRAAGVIAEHVDADTPDEERDRVWWELSDGVDRKDVATIHDHAGNWARHGLPADDVEWSLDDGAAVKERVDVLSVRYCPACWMVYRSDTCPACGMERVKTQRQIRQVAADLVEIARAKKEAAIESALARHTVDKKRAKYYELVDTANARGYKTTWAAIRWKQMYGHWPPVKAWEREVPA